MAHHTECDGYGRGFSVRWVGWLAAAIGLALVPVAAYAENLLDREPFDLIQLDEANGKKKYEVLPIPFPNRRLPAGLPRSGTLDVRFVRAPTRLYKVRWANIAEIQLYEQMILAEGIRLTRNDKFDDAYWHFAYLKEHQSTLPGLDDAIGDFLYRNASAAFQAGRHDDAISIITALFEQNPERAGIERAVNRIAEKLLEAQFTQGDYVAARSLLKSLPQRFPTLKLAAVREWNQRLDAAAGKFLAEATAHLDAKRFDDARAAIRGAVAIRPESAAARRLGEKLFRARPQVVVAVGTPFAGSLSHRLDDAASRRVRRLLQTPLMELRGFSDEGGVYACSLGEVVLDDTGTRLTILLNSPPDGAAEMSAYDLARSFLAAAREDDLTGRELARRMAGLEVEDARTLHVDWTRPHIRPEALLQLDFEPHVESATERGMTALYRFAGASGERALFERRAHAAAPSSGAPREIVEQYFEDEDEAIRALRRGEIDVIERLNPWNVQRLQKDPQIAVGTYALPTVHLLILNPEGRAAASGEMRRAIAYAIDRPAILDQVILAGDKTAGFALISGPFPIGSELNDSIAYGYNRQVTQRPFAPLVATTLATVARHGESSRKLTSRGLTTRGSTSRGSTTDESTTRGESQEPVDESPLIFVHPPGDLARTVCQVIAQQLSTAEIVVDLREATSAEIASGSVAWDLRYAELAIWEPVVDARRLLGPQGEAGVRSPYIALALRRLDEAQNWREVREYLHGVHRAVHNELAVIGLWQTVNAFAHRNDISGIGDHPVTLYDNIAEWRKTLTAQDK